MEAVTFEVGSAIDVPDGVYATGWVHPHSAYLVVQDKKVVSQEWLRDEEGLFVRDGLVYSAPTWLEATDEDDMTLSSGQYGSPRIEFKLPARLKPKIEEKK